MTEGAKERARGYATEVSEDEPAASVGRYTSFTHPSKVVPVGQDYWAKAAAAPKPVLGDFRPSRRALLELTIADNASPLVQEPDRAIPAELHAMVEELISGSNWPLTTCNAIGIYLDALCRRERICRRDVNRSMMLGRHAQLHRAADPWLPWNHQSAAVEADNLSWLEKFVKKAPVGQADDYAEAHKYSKEMAETWRRILDLFGRIADRTDRHILNRYIGSFLASCSYVGDTEHAQAAFLYAQRDGNTAPPMFYYFLVTAFANAGDYSGARTAYEAFVQERWRLRDIGVDEDAKDDSTRAIRLNTRRYRVGTTYVGAPLVTIADIASATAAAMLRVSFQTSNSIYAERLWSAMMRRDDLAPPIRGAIVIEYILARIETGEPGYVGPKVIDQLRGDEEVRKALATPYNYRALLRRITDFPKNRRPGTISKLYRCLMEDSHELAFPYFTSELHLTIDALVAAAVEKDRGDHIGKAILLDVIELYHLSKRDEDEGRLLVETSQSERWFRLNTGVTYRLCGALALFGMHDEALSIYADMVRVALPGLTVAPAIASPASLDTSLIDPSSRFAPIYSTPPLTFGSPATASNGNISTRTLARRSNPGIVGRGEGGRSKLHTLPSAAVGDEDYDESTQTGEGSGDNVPPHAYLMLGTHALGERVIGADPSLANILTVWTAQEQLEIPKASKWMQTRARIRAQAVPAEVEALSESAKAALQRLFEAWAVDKHYPVRLMTRSQARLDAIRAGKGDADNGRWRRIWSAQHTAPKF